MTTPGFPRYLWNKAILCENFGQLGVKASGKFQNDEEKEHYYFPIGFDFLLCLDIDFYCLNEKKYFLPIYRFHNLFLVKSFAENRSLF